MINRLVEGSDPHIREAMSVLATDPLLANHCRNVAYYSVHLFDAIKDSWGLDETDRPGLFAAALLHDIGKTRIDHHILEKPGRLTTEEYERVKCHAHEGAVILSSFPFGQRISPFVLHHHERFDGRGYPHGLRDDHIPLFSRIIAVADAFDAMTTFRHYRKTLSKEYALGEILENAGSQFDPRIADVFIRLIDQGSIRFPL